MAVWQLDGPTDIQGIPKGTAPIQTHLEQWWPGVGLLMVCGLSTYGVVTLDGVYRHRSNGVGLVNHWPSHKRMMALLNTDLEDGTNKPQEWSAEPMAFLRSPAGTEDESVWAGPPAGPNYVRLDDRRIYVYASKIYSVKDGNTVVEGPVLLAFPTGAAATMPGRRYGELFISHGGVNPKGVFYDSATRQLSSPYFYVDPPTAGVTCTGLSYVPEFGVLVAKYSAPTFHLRIWSLEVKPTILTPPEAFIGVAKSGQIVTYRVKVTGAQNDPAEGELVNWSLEGAGILFDEQSSSGADGYALARVQYGLKEVGPSLVKASVIC
jgi:hypothetical protein